MTEFLKIEPSYISKEGCIIVWKGVDEEKVKQIIETELKPSSILCIGYSTHIRPPKSRPKLKKLIRVKE